MTRFRLPIVLFALAGVATVLLGASSSPAGTTARPGNPVAGLTIFKQFCAQCHNFKAAGINEPGKSGTDLDARKPTFSQIVKLIVQGGGGGTESERILRKLTWEQIYDVAAFVSEYAGSSGPLLVGPSVDLAAKPRTAHPVRQPNGLLAGTSGEFTATLKHQTLRWKLNFGYLPGGAKGAHIHIGNRGKMGRPIKRLCAPCTSPAAGTLKLSRPQARAMRNGRTYINVVPANRPDNGLRGQILPTGQ